MESTLYETLKTLGYVVTPIGPDSDDQPAKGSVDPPMILYRRKNTEYERDLSGGIQLTNAQMEVIIIGNTSQQADSIADEVTLLVDNKTFSGFQFFLSNRFIAETDLTTIHLWFTVISE